MTDCKSAKKKHNIKVIKANIGLACYARSSLQAYIFAHKYFSYVMPAEASPFLVLQALHIGQCFFEFFYGGKISMYQLIHWMEILILKPCGDFIAPDFRRVIPFGQ